MACLASNGKTILILMNTLFGLCGLGCFVLGLMLKFGKDILNDMLRTVLTQKGEQIEPMLTAANLSKHVFLDEFDLSELLADFAIVLIVVGVVLLSAVIVGYCGACFMNPWILILYSVMVILLVLVQITGLMLLFGSRDTLSDIIKSPVKSSMKSYHGDQALNLVFVVWNVVMLLMSCCGVDSYKDFSVASGWKKEYTDDGTTITGLATPLVCCKDAARTDITNYTATTANCAKPPLDIAHSNYMRGCYDAVWDEIDNYKPTVIGVTSGIIAFQTLPVFVSLWLAQSIKEQKQTRLIG